MEFPKTAAPADDSYQSVRPKVLHLFRHGSITAVCVEPRLWIPDPSHSALLVSGAPPHRLNYRTSGRTLQLCLLWSYYLRHYLLICLAGGLGSLARYECSLRLQSKFDRDFPLGTLFVNVVGCFLFGLVWTLGEEKMRFSPETRTILLSGFMGGFTTFSTFGFETASYLRTGQWTAALQNISLQVFLGIVAVIAGMAVARKM